MSYRLSILPRAQKELGRLPSGAYERVRDAIRGLGEEPRPPGCRKLAGRSGWRIRVGHYRVLYEVEDSSLTVTVLHVGHRRCLSLSEPGEAESHYRRVRAARGLQSAVIALESPREGGRSSQSFGAELTTLKARSRALPIALARVKRRGATKASIARLDRRANARLECLWN